MRRFLPLAILASLVVAQASLPAKSESVVAQASLPAKSESVVAQASLPAFPVPAALEPAGTARTLPLAADAWSATSVNVVAGLQNSLITDRSTQYAAFYAADSTLVLARRDIGSDTWTTHRTGLTGRTTDAHNTVAIAVDGDGFLHVAWDHHDNPLNYARGVAPGSLELGPRQPMTGRHEDSVTYPSFLRLPDGDLLFLYRDGRSGRGNLALNRYSIRTKTWTQVQPNLIDGEGRRSAYPSATLDPRGVLHLAWVWRDSPDVATNHDLCYARSADGGATWTTVTGEPLRVPITAATADYALRLPTGRSLMNPPSLGTDGQGRPYLVSYWRPESSDIPQFHLVTRDTDRWVVQPVTRRTTPFVLAGTSTKRPPLSRAIVVARSEPAKPRAVSVVYRDDERGGRIVAAVCRDLGRSDWEYHELTAGSVGAWEPSFDPAQWSRSGQLHLLVQHVAQRDGDDQQATVAQPSPIDSMIWSPFGTSPSASSLAVAQASLPAIQGSTASRIAGTEAGATQSTVHRSPFTDSVAQASLPAKSATASPPPTTPLRDLLDFNPGWKLHIGDVPTAAGSPTVAQASLPAKSGTAAAGSPSVAQASLPAKSTAAAPQIAGTEAGATNVPSGPSTSTFNLNSLPPPAAQPDFDDTAWKPVTLPRAWNEDSAFREDIVDHPTGIAWYRKTFTLPADTAGRKVFLEFEGARQVAEVWLNGRRVGAHENGINAFGFDLTDFVQPAPALNVLAVRTDNAWDLRESLSGARFQWADRNFNANYGGLPKNVRLHIADRVYQTLPLYASLGTTGVYVYATDFDISGRAATIHAESEIRNESEQPRTFTYRVQIADRDGRVVAAFDGGRYTLARRESVTAHASARVADLHFWSWGYGYLYTVTTSLESDAGVFDSVVTRTGFRKTEFAHGLVTLNDRALQLKGYAQRTSNEWPAVGLSVPPWLSDFSNGLMVESGASLVRWMHITPWKQDVESCDRVGLLQMLPAGDSERDAQGRQWVTRTEVMRDAIVYNRNNPSVLVYESGNNGISEAHMAEMKALRDRFDPHGGRAIGSRDMLGSAIAEYGGEMLYVNKSARKPVWQTEYSRDEGARKFWDEFSPPFHKDGDGPLHKGQSASTYNRNQDSHAIEDVVRWYDFWRERPGTGTRVNSGGVNIIFSDSNTHHRGAENFRRSGEVDAMRLPKDGFFAHQVMWDGWVDIEKPRIHLLGHWNYAPGVKKDLVAVSSADSVEFFLNGRSLGRSTSVIPQSTRRGVACRRPLDSASSVARESNDPIPVSSSARSAARESVDSAPPVRQTHRFLFTLPAVAWEPGTLTAVGYDPSGAKVCETARTTAGEPAALRLTVRTGPGGLRADGADLALYEIEVVDAQGRRCPTALNTVEFALSGPAEWRGGIAQGPDNFILAQTLPVEGGVNRVLVRSTTAAGRIVLHAKAVSPTVAQASLPAKSASAGTEAGATPSTSSQPVAQASLPAVPGSAAPLTSTIAEAELALDSIPVAVSDGWSRTFAADALAGRLDRGPTPAGPSFTVSRVAVPVAKITATDGAHPEFACDDDETTLWSGRQPIVFALARPATLSEITLKTAGFRARSYPIRITLDGTEIFRGVTPRSLGYATLALKRATGRMVRIEPLAGAEAREAFGAITELVDQGNATTGEEKVGTGELGLIEIEFYEPVP